MKPEYCALSISPLYFHMKCHARNEQAPLRSSTSKLRLELEGLSGCCRARLRGWAGGGQPHCFASLHYGHLLSATTTILMYLGPFSHKHLFSPLQDGNWPAAEYLGAANLSPPDEQNITTATNTWGENSQGSTSAWVPATTGSYLTAGLRTEVGCKRHKGLWPLSRSQLMPMDVGDL